MRAAPFKLEKKTRPRQKFLIVESSNEFWAATIRDRQENGTNLAIEGFCSAIEVVGNYLTTRISQKRNSSF
jgi:hypothetical protein